MVALDSIGAIKPGVANLLALSAEQQRQINAELGQILQQYRAAEAASAQSTTNHLEQGPGERVTLIVQLDSATAARVQTQFDAALRSHLTDQQFDIFHDLARGWASQNLAPDTQEPKTYSVVRRPDGTYGISIVRGQERSEMSGDFKLDYCIPAHLTHFFASLQTPREPVATPPGD